MIILIIKAIVVVAGVAALVKLAIDIKAKVVGEADSAVASVVAEVAAVKTDVEGAPVVPAAPAAPEEAPK